METWQLYTVLGGILFAPHLPRTTAYIGSTVCLLIAISFGLTKVFA